MQDRFKYRVKFETDGQAEIFDVTKLNMELGQIFFKREDGQYYNIGIGCKDIELMQCTGLKDKNGKLIYEGDIVKMNNYILQIVYNKDYACFCAENKNLIGYFRELRNINAFEVIGNIYENKELLNG